jgi:hypothetical protein
MSSSFPSPPFLGDTEKGRNKGRIEKLIDTYNRQSYNWRGGQR